MAPTTTTTPVTAATNACCIYAMVSTVCFISIDSFFFLFIVLLFNWFFQYCDVVGIFFFSFVIFACSLSILPCQLSSIDRFIFINHVLRWIDTPCEHTYYIKNGINTFFCERTFLSDFVISHVIPCLLLFYPYISFIQHIMGTFGYGNWRHGAHCQHIICKEIY